MDGSYAVKLLKEQSPERVRQESTLQQALSKAGVTTPAPLYVAGTDVVGQIGTQAFVVSHFLAGEHPDPKEGTFEIAEELGRTLARVHNAWRDLVLPQPQWMSRGRAERLLRSLPADIRDRVERSFTTGAAIFDLDLPYKTIHGDLHADNVLFQNGRMSVVLDLEEAEHNLRLIDAVRTAIDIHVRSGQPWHPVIEAVFDGYDQLSRLLAAERAATTLALRYVASVIAMWFFARQDQQTGTRYLALAERAETF